MAASTSMTVVDSSGSVHADVHGTRGGVQGGAGLPPSRIGVDDPRYDMKVPRVRSVTIQYGEVDKASSM
jgi:hypothetical protein